MVTEARAPIRVAIIEDEPVVAMMTRAGLEAEGMVVEVISKDFALLFGASAPVAWDEVDVAVVDMMLPGMSGLDIIRFIADRHPRIFRVVCTAASPLVNLEVKTVANAVVLKPFSVVELAEVIRRGVG